MSAAVLKRFIIIATVATAVAFLVALAVGHFNRPPGDYEVEKGDIHLSVHEYDQALEWFDQALIELPGHRGAHMGRAIVFMQTDRLDEAEDELRLLIDILGPMVEDDPEDLTGRGALAAAHANLGILLDRQARYEEALDSYVEALRVDEQAVEGPGLFHRIIHNPRPSTIRDRARYIFEQLQLPEDERVLSVPEIDAEQRMFKP